MRGMPSSRAVWALLLCLCVLPRAGEAQERTTLAVVVSAQASEELAREARNPDTLMQIFKRKKLLWRGGGRIVPVNLPADSALRRQFSVQILKQSPEALDDYWNQQYFQGVLPPHVLASEAAVLRFVAQTVNAIGYLSACSVDDGLRVLMLIDPDGNLLPATQEPDCGNARDS